MPHQIHFYLPTWFWWAFFVVCLIAGTWGTQRRMAERRADRRAQQEERAVWEQMRRVFAWCVQDPTACLAAQELWPPTPNFEPEVSETNILDSEIDLAVDRLFDSAFTN